MFKILARYTVGNVLLIFFIIMSILSFIFCFYLILEMVVQEMLPMTIVLKTIPCILPQVFRATFPVGFLIAICYFFSKISTNNEIIALKAMGVSSWQIFMPVWILGIVVSLFSVYLYDLTVSWGTPNAAKLFVEGLEETIINKLKKNKRFATPDNDITIEVSEVTEKKELLDLVIISTKGQFQGSAKKAKLKINLMDEMPKIEITMWSMSIESEEGTLISPDEFSHIIPLPQFTSISKPTEPAMGDVKKELAKIKEERDQYRRQLAAISAFALVTGDNTPYMEGMWTDRIYKENDFQYRINRCNLSIPRTWASGFSCFFFAWIGIPLVVLMSQYNMFRSDHLYSTAIGPILVALIFYPVFMFGIQGAKDGYLLPSFAWLGNVVLGIIGFILIKKVNQH